MALGLRVVRGPDWNHGNQDGGPNHAGTVTDIIGEDRVKVTWDMGLTSICRAGQPGTRDLTVFDTAPAGEVHINTQCDECNETGILGIRWKCSVCDDFDLCTPCYLDDCHKTTHAFLRIDVTGATPVKVAKRSMSQRQRVMGMFPNSEVVRGPDWNRLDEEDGGDGTVGIVEDIVSFKKGDIQRDAVKVNWPSGKSFSYRVGHAGKVDVVCREEAPGPDYYPDHMPTVEVTTLKAMGSNQMTQSQQVDVGDKVCVDMTEPEFAAVQKQSLKWNISMGMIVGEVLTVKDMTMVGDCLVEYDRNTMIVAKAALTKVPNHKKRDYVRVIESTEKLKRLQQGHGGWVDSMDEVKGKVGRIAVIDSDGDVGVGFGDAEHVFHPLCLIPESSADNDKSDSSDDESSLLDLAIGGGGAGRSSRRDDSDSDGDPALDLLQGFAGLLLLERLVRRSTDDVKVDFVNAVIGGREREVQSLLQRHPGFKNISYKDVPCFIIAAIKEHFGVVKVMHEAGIDIDTKDEKGNTALMIALSNSNGSISRYLLLQGASVNNRNDNGQTSLHVAVRAKYLDGVKFLLASGANINVQDIVGDTPLHDAIERQHDVIARMLIQRPGLDVWLKNRKSFTTLAFACFKPHAVSVEALIDKDRRLVTSTGGRASGNCYPLHIAAINNHLTEAKLLLENGKADVDCMDDIMRSPLHLAAEEGKHRMVELLLRANATHSLKDVKGNTPLHSCLQGSRTEGMFLQLLLGLRNQGEIDERIKTAEVLITNGADTDARNWSRDTPLDVCTDPRIREGVQRILVQRRAAQSQQGFSVFQLFRKKCQRCSTSTANTRFVPCNHVVSCLACSWSYTRCPQCRKLVVKVVPV